MMVDLQELVLTVTELNSFLSALKHSTVKADICQKICHTITRNKN